MNLCALFCTTGYTKIIKAVKAVVSYIIFRGWCSRYMDRLGKRALGYPPVKWIARQFCLPEGTISIILALTAVINYSYIITYGEIFLQVMGDIDYCQAKVVMSNIL